MATRILSLLALITLLLAGCAKSPQQVMLAPQIDTDAQLSRSPVVQFNIVDNRADPVLGTRGGVYATSHLTLARPLDEALRPEIERTLQALGAELNQVTPFPVRLTLYLDTLTYRTEEATTPPINVTLHAAITAKGSSKEREYEGRWESTQKHQFLRIPSEAKNEEIINELLSETLSRMFNDPKLLRFLQQP